MDLWLKGQHNSWEIHEMSTIWSKNLSGVLRILSVAEQQNRSWLSFLSYLYIKISYILQYDNTNTSIKVFNCCWLTWLVAWSLPCRSVSLTPLDCHCHWCDVTWCDMCVSSPVSRLTKLPGVHADTGLAVLLTARTRTRTGIPTSSVIQPATGFYYQNSFHWWNDK